MRVLQTCRPRLTIGCAILATGFAGRENMREYAGSRRRFWSLVGAVGISYLVTTALIAARTAGL